MRYSKIFAKLALSVLLAGSAGCAGDPVNPRVPLDNAANPQAPEVEFVMPPNPFQDEQAGPQVNSDDSLPIDQSAPDRSADRPTGHPAGHGHRGFSPAAPQDQTEKNLHREHSQ